jgi:hypothetical protein
LPNQPSAPTEPRELSLPILNPDQAEASFWGIEPIANEVYTSRHLQREILLSKAAPENRWCGVSLQGISPDGAVSLLVLCNGRTLTALKGDYFESEEFGRRGLELKEVDQQNYSAVLIRTWSE